MKRTIMVNIMLFGICIVLTVYSLGTKKIAPLQYNNTFPKQIQTHSYTKGVWISYTEFADMIKNKSKEEYNNRCHEVINNIYKKGYNTVILHVRAHCDSYYLSDIFPFAAGIKKPNFDPLSIFLSIARSFSINVHGWVNPYRGFEKMQQHFTSLESSAVVKWDEKTYLNPASISAQKLIIDGVKELLTKYNLQGIHIDDYFYPTDDENFDKENYENYKKQSKNPLSLSDFRRQNINSMVIGIYQTTKKHGVQFGISPCADVEKNSEILFADVQKWLSGGFCDYICPQLYFGFHYPDEEFKFDNLVHKWLNLKSENVKMYIGLGAYKKGQTDAESDEWITDKDLIKKQIDYIGSYDEISGYCIYSYSYM